MPNFVKTLSAYIPLVMPVRHWAGKGKAMRRSMLVVLLLMSSPAWSAWMQMSSEGAGSVMYADPDSIRIDGPLRRVTEMHDLKAADKTRGNRSTRVVAEYDCKEERIRVLQEEYFSGQMGAGERLGGNTEPTDWFSIAPGTRGATLLKFVCSR